MRKEIICYSAKKTARLDYILDLLLSELMGCTYIFCTDIADFMDLYAQKHKEQNRVYFFYYCDAPNAQLDALGIDFMPACSLLTSLDICPQAINMTTWADLPCGFAQPKPQTKAFSFDFDLLAWAFYLLVRYEEYLPYPKDAHGRFSSVQSMAKKHNFLRQPLINQLAMAWDSHIADRQKKWLPRNVLLAYVFRPSYDIDYMFAYRAKGFLRQIGGVFRDILHLDFKQLISKIQVWLGQKNDPFDTFAYLDELHQKYGLQLGKNTPFYFFLIADWGKFDKNISHRQPLFAQIVAQIAKKYEVGLHPSYASNDKPADTLLRAEKNRLSLLTQTKIIHSRQHFLRLNLPATYRNLLSEEILYDFSMGYADALGFRASIATPFHWFDLEKNQKTDLIVLPFALMDVTLKDYLRLSPEAARQEIAYFVETYKSVGGTMFSLWHNSSLGDLGGWGAAWRGVYEELLITAMTL